MQQNNEKNQQRPPRNNSPKNGNKSSSNVKNKKPQKSNVGNDFLILLNYLSHGLNYIGEILLSDAFIGTIEKVFQEHLDLLNYILRNLNSNYFWELNLKYSILLTVIFMAKGFISNNFLSFEILGLISIACLLILKILDSKGDALELSQTFGDYTTAEEEKEEEKEKNVNYNKKENFVFAEDTIESNLKEKDIPTKMDEIEKQIKGEKDENQISDDAIKSLQKLYREVKVNKSSEFGGNIVEKALKGEDNLKHKIQFNQVFAQLQNRDLLNSAIKPLEDIMKTPKSDDMGQKYEDIILN
jgi:hypothetical protein